MLIYTNSPVPGTNRKAVAACRSVWCEGLITVADLSRLKPGVQTRTCQGPAKAGTPNASQDVVGGYGYL